MMHVDMHVCRSLLQCGLGRLGCGEYHKSQVYDCAAAWMWSRLGMCFVCLTWLYACGCTLMQQGILFGQRVDVTKLFEIKCPMMRQAALYLITGA